MVVAQLVLLVLTGAALLIATPYFRERKRKEEQQIQMQQWQGVQLGLPLTDPRSPIWNLPAQSEAVQP